MATNKLEPGPLILMYQGKGDSPETLGMHNGRPYSAQTPAEKAQLQEYVKRSKLFSEVRELMPRAWTAAVLGVSRQGVAAALARGELREVEAASGVVGIEAAGVWKLAMSKRRPGRPPLRWPTEAKLRAARQRSRAASPRTASTSVKRS